MCQIEMIDPGPDPVVGIDGRGAEFECGYPRLENLERGVDDRAPAAELRLLLGIRNGVGAGDPGPAVVGGINPPR